MYKLLIRPSLFLFAPETAHKITFILLSILSKIPFIHKILKSKNNNPVDLFGITFPNAIGLAAGLDKDAQAFDMLGTLGFGFVEIGTVTPKAQPGNPAPRLFRLKKNNALINRMGFNNKGVDYTVRKLQNKKTNVIIGGNIGKNKITPNAEAVSDYLISFEKLFDYVDYFAINVSSPNTPNLRELQDKEPLKNLLVQIMNANNNKKNPKPILLKIAPDLTTQQIDDIIEIFYETKISGIIAANTTISRENISYSDKEIEDFGNGGLSGEPVKDKSTEIIKYISQKTNNEIPIIGVGGIMNAQNAIDKLNAGASLVQIYTGFIYEGPKLIKEINKKLSEINS